MDYSNCAHAGTKGFCRRCLLEHLETLVAIGSCNSTELSSELVCGNAMPGRNPSPSACDRAFTGMCGAVADNLTTCEDCVIDNAPYFVTGWGCGGDVTSFCDQVR
jgi:hypothetical protein